MSFFADQIVGTAVGVLTVDASGVVQGTNTASRSLRTFSEETVALSRGFETLGRLTGAAGLAIVGTLAVAGREFIAFETKLKDIESLGSTTPAAMEKLSAAMLGLAQEMGKNPTELADALYNVASAGFSVDESLIIVSAASKAAVAGLTTVATAADLISSILLSYGLAATHATEVSNVLFATVQIGRVKFEQLAAVMGTLTPTARALNVSLEELGAGMASLTNQGLSARQAAFQLNSLMQVLLKPTKALAAAMEQFGIESFQSLIAAEGLSGALDFLNTISGQNATTLQKLLGNQRATRAALILSAQGAEEYTDALKATEGAQAGAGATQTSFAKQTEAVSFQLKQAEASARVLAITVGSVLAPGIALAAKFLASLAQTATAVFNALPDGLQTTVVYLGAAVGAGLLLISALAILQATALRAAESMLLFSRANQQAAASSLAAAGAARAQGTSMRQSLRGLPASKMIKLGFVLVGVAILAKQINALFTGIANETSITMQQIVIQGFEGIVKAWNATVGHLPGLDLDELDSDIDRFQTALATQKFAVKVGLTVEKGLGDNADSFLIKELGLSFFELQERAAAAGISIEAYISKQAALKNITLENVDAADALGEATAAQAEETQAAATEAAAAQSEYEDLSAVIDSLGKKVPEATAAFKQAREEAGLTTPLTPTADAFKAFVDDLNGAVDEVLAANGAIGSLDEPLAFLRSQLGLTGDTVGETFVQLEELGFGLDFSPAQEEVLALAGDIEDVDQALAGLDDAVANNADDMAMWQGNIDLVDNTLGDHTNTLIEFQRQLEAGEITQEEFNKAIASGKAHIAYQELNKLVADGLIPLQEANDIRDAGQWLIERSVGGLQDERVEQARLIPLIAEYVKRHDDLLGKQKDLSTGQKAFLGVLQDENTQSALNTVQMLSYLASIGQLPKEKVTQVIMNLAQSDPALAALFADLGLLNQGVDIPVTVTMDEAQQRLHDIQVQRDALLAQKAQLQIRIAADPQDQQAIGQLAATNAAIDELDGRQATISTAIDSGSQSQLETAIAEDKALVEELDASTATIALGFDTSGLENDPEVQAVIDELRGLYAEAAKLPGDAITSFEDGTERLKELDGQIAEIQQTLDAGFTTDRFGVRVELDETAKKQLEDDKAALLDTKAEIQVRLDNAEFSAEAIAIDQQIADWEAEGVTVVARIQAEDEEAGLQSLEEARRAIQARMGTLNLANPDDAQAFKQLDAQLRVINQLLTAGHDVNFTVEGEEGLQRAAVLLGTTANPTPRVVEVRTQGEETVSALNQELDRVGKNLADLEEDVRDGVAGALDEASAEWARFIQIGQQKILFETAVDPEAAAQTARDFNTLADGLVKRNQDIVAYLKANPGMDPASVEKFNAELVQNQEIIAQLRANATIPLAFETGSGKDALRFITSQIGATEEQIRAIKDEPWMLNDPATLDTLHTLEAQVAQLEVLRTEIINLTDNGRIDFLATLRTEVATPSDATGAAVLDAATGGSPLPTVTINGRTVIDTGAVAVAQGEIKATEGAILALNDTTGKIRVDATDMEAAVRFLDENQITDHQILNYEFVVDDKQLDGTVLVLQRLLEDAALTEEQISDLTSSGRSLADGFVVELAFDDGDLPASIDRLREYVKVFSNDTQDEDGDYAIQIKGNADELFAVLKAVNPAIQDAQLNRNTLMTLDANNDGLLSTLELSKVAAQTIEDDPFFAYLYMEVRGDEDLTRKLNDVKNVAVELSEDSHTVHVTAETEEDLNKFLDENSNLLAGKEVVITVVGEKGVEAGIERVERIPNFTPKIVPITIQTTTAELALKSFVGATAATAADGVTVDVQADTTDAAAAFLALNREELDGKPVRVFVRDQATGDLVLLDSFIFDNKDVPVDATDNVTPVVDALTEEDFKANVISIPIVGAVVPGTGLDGAGGDVPAPTTVVTADNAPALGVAQSTPGEMQALISAEPAPEATVNAFVDMAAISTSADTAAGDVETAKTRIVTALDNMGTEGAPSAQVAAEAVAAGLNTGLGALDDIVAGNVNNALRVLVALQSTALTTGEYLGLALDAGIARGIQRGTPAIELWAKFAALRAFLAAKAALGIRSPSTKGAFIGDMFALGLLNSLQAGEDPIVAQARRMAGAITDEFTNATVQPMTVTGLTTNAARSPLATQSALGDIARVQQAAVISQRSMGNFAPQFNINGAGDPAAVAQEVFRQMHGAARRLVAGGGAMEA